MSEDWKERYHSLRNQHSELQRKYHERTEELKRTNVQLSKIENLLRVKERLDAKNAGQHSLGSVLHSENEGIMRSLYQDKARLERRVSELEKKYKLQHEAIEKKKREVAVLKRAVKRPVPQHTTNSLPIRTSIIKDEERERLQDLVAQFKVRVEDAEAQLEVVRKENEKLKARGAMSIQEELDLSDGNRDAEEDARRELRDARAQQQLLQLRVDAMEKKMRAQNEVAQGTFDQLEEYNRRIRDLRRELIDAHEAREEAQAKAASVDELKRRLTTLQDLNRQLEDEIMTLSKAPFDTDASDTYKRKLLDEVKRRELESFRTTQQVEAELREQLEASTKQIKLLEEQVQALENENASTKPQQVIVKNETKIPPYLFADDDLDMEELDHALTLVRRKQEYEKNGRDFDFFDDVPEDNLAALTRPEIKRKIDTLLKENFRDKAELEKAESMLKVQMSINRDLHLELEELQNKQSLEHKELIVKVQDLEAIALKRLQKINVLEAQLKQYRYSVGGAKVTQLSLLKAAGQIDSLQEIDDRAAALLTEASDLASDENLAEIWLRGIEYIDGLVRPGSSTFAVLDFFNFESQATQWLPGDRPQLDFATSFKVTVDDLFLRYLATESCILEICEAQQADYEVIARCELPLAPLLDSRPALVLDRIPIKAASGSVAGYAHIEIRLALPVTELYQLFLDRHPKERADIEKAMLDQLSSCHDTTLAVKDEQEHEALQNEIEIVIQSVTGLPPRFDTHCNPWPYIHYQFLSFADTFTPVIQNSTDATFDHSTIFPVPSSSQVLAVLRTERLTFTVLDFKDDATKAKQQEGKDNDSDDEDDDGILVGSTEINLSCLADGQNIFTTVPLTNDIGSQSGAIRVAIRWRHDFKDPRSSTDVSSLNGDELRWILAKFSPLKDGQVDYISFLHDIDAPKSVEACRSKLNAWVQRFMLTSGETKASEIIRKNVDCRFGANDDHDDIASALIAAGLGAPADEICTLLRHTRRAAARIHGDDVPYDLLQNLADLCTKPLPIENTVRAKLGQHFDSIRTRGQHIEGIFSDLDHLNCGKLPRPLFKDALRTLGFHLVDEPGESKPRRSSSIAAEMDDLINNISLKRIDIDQAAKSIKVPDEAKEEPIIMSHHDKVVDKWEQEQRQFQTQFIEAMNHRDKTSTHGKEEEKKDIAEAPAPAREPVKPRIQLSKPSPQSSPLEKQYPVEQHVAQVHQVKHKLFDNKTDHLRDVDRSNKAAESVLVEDTVEQESTAGPYDNVNVRSALQIDDRDEWAAKSNAASVVCAEAALNKVFGHGRSDRPNFRPHFTKLDPNGTGAVRRKQFAWILQQQAPETTIGNEEILALMQHFASVPDSSKVEYMPFIRFCEHHSTAASAAVMAAKRFAFHMGVQHRLVEADRDRMGSLPVDVFATTLKDAGIDLSTSESNCIARLFPAKTTNFPLSAHSVSIAYPAFGEYAIEQEASLQLRRLENRIRNAAQRLTEEKGKDALRALFRSCDTRGKPALGHHDLARFFETLLESSISDKVELNALLARYMGRDSKNGIAYNEVLQIMKEIPLPIAATATNKPDWKHLRARARATVLEAADRLGSTAAKTAIDAEFTHFDWRGTSLVAIDEFVVAALRAGFAITRADLATIGRRFAQHEDDPKSKIAYTRFLAWATSSNSAAATASTSIDTLLQKFCKVAQHPEWDRAFADYDVEDRRSIEFQDFRRACIRDLDVNITDVELRTIADEFSEGRNRIKYTEFITAVYRATKEENSLALGKDKSSQLQEVSATVVAIIKRGIEDGVDIRALFEDRDEGYTGSLGKKVFAEIMKTNLGARLSTEDINLLASRFGGDSSTIHYIEMLNILIPLKSGADDGWRLEERLRTMIKRKFDWWIPGRLRKAFRHFDINKKGQISQPELADGLCALKLKHSAEQLHTLFKSMDLDKDGLVSCCEFIVFVKDPWHYFVEQKVKRAVRHSGLSARNARRMLDALDTGSRLLGRRDFATALNRLGVVGLTTSEVQRLAQRFDTQDDGNVVIDCFFNFLQGTAEHNVPDHDTQGYDDRLIRSSPHSDKRDETPVLRLLRTEIRRVAQHHTNGRGGPNYSAIFRDLDRDGSGKLDRREFRRALESFNLNLSSAELSRVVNHFDRDGDGRISFREFVTFADANLEDIVSKVEDAVRTEIQRIARRSSSSFASVFRAFDGNRSGHVNRQEFRRGLEKLGFELDASLLEGLIDRFDTDGDGRIDYDEFIRFFKIGSGSVQEDDIDELVCRLKSLVQDATESGGASLLDCFRHFDIDGSGDVDERELLQGMRRLGIELTAYEAKKLAERFPSRRTGSIKYRDFCDAIGSSIGQCRSDVGAEEIVERLRRMVREANQKGAQIYECFEYFDVDGSGGIDAEELRRGLKKLDLSIKDSEVTCLMEAYAGSRRGCIRYRDFVRAICPPHPTSPGHHKNHDAPIVNKVRDEIRRAAEREGLSCTKKYLRQVFRDMDDNESGKVNRKELRRGLERLGLDLTSSELTRVLDEIDRNGDGRCSLSEFIAFFSDSIKEEHISDIQTVVRNEVCRLAKSSRGVPSLRHAFAAFDKNGSGQISRREFRLELEQIGIELSSVDMDALLDRFDLDRDGKIDYHEFARFAQGGGEGLRENELDDLYTKIKRRLGSSFRGQDVLKVFMYFDRDNSGHIDDEEFQRGLSKLGLELSAYETKKLLDRFPHHHGNGRIVYRDFVEALGLRPSREEDERVHSPPRHLITSDEKSNKSDHAILTRLRSEIRRLAERRGGEKADFSAVFREFDDNDSGTINRRELGRGLRALGIQHTPNDLDYVVSAFDENGDGKISKREFMHFVKKRQQNCTVADDDALARVRDLLREAIHSGKRPDESLARYDRDASGTIDQDDFRKAMKKIDIPLSKFEISHVFDRFAQRSTHRLPYNDFLRAMRGKGSSALASPYASPATNRSDRSASRRRRHHHRHHHHRRGEH